jgi:hypothetical protein
LLVAFSVLEKIAAPFSELAVSFVFTLADILSAWFLTTLVPNGNEKWKTAA